MTLKLEEIVRNLAVAGFKIGAIKISAEKPFPWASGTFNPIYNDNRMFLWHPEYRTMILEGMILLDEENSLTDKYVEPNVIAGTATAGIPHGCLLADMLGLPFIYIRDKPKDHGLKNRIEGIDNNKDLNGATVLLIEDLISTGSSSVSAVEAIRKANGKISNCFSIFNYNLLQSTQMFAGEIPFDKEGNSLDKPCEVNSLLNYSTLIATGIEEGFIKPEQEEMLKSWMEDQDNWGDNHEFPRIKK